MRANYAASLAAVSVTGYITGAGDRHLENFLMHTASGTLIPIDFGYANVTALDDSHWVHQNLSFIWHVHASQSHVAMSSL